MEWPHPVSVPSSEDIFDMDVKDEDVRFLLRTISPDTSSTSILKRLRHLTRINIHLADDKVTMGLGSDFVAPLLFWPRGPTHVLWLRKTPTPTVPLRTQRIACSPPALASDIFSSGDKDTKPRRLCSVFCTGG